MQFIYYLFTFPFPCFFSPIADESPAEELAAEFSKTDAENLEVVEGAKQRITIIQLKEN